MRGLSTWLSVGAFVVARAATGQADVLVYSNDFESGLSGTTAGGVTTTGLTASGTLAGKTLTTAGLGLATPSGGTANNTKYLTTFASGSAGATTGLGANVTKVVSASPGTVPANNETVTLPLNGLVPGTTYTVGFDVLFGASWDGTGGSGSATGTYGPDYFRFAVGATTPLNAIFSNASNGSEPNKIAGDTYANVGAPSPQTYRDSSPVAPPGSTSVGRFTGADAYFFGASPNAAAYADLYSIYTFSRGVNNPTLTFTATASSATLEWARYSGAADSPDEYWALDNLTVTAVPEPGALCAVGGGLALGLRRRTR